MTKKQIAAVALLIFLGGTFGYLLGSTSNQPVVNANQQIKVTNKDRNPSRNIGAVNFDLYWQVWDALEKGYYKQPINEGDLFYSSLKGMVSGLDDPYTVFLDPPETDEFNEELSGNFEGIGAEIGLRDGQLTIVAPLPNTPASNAGLRPGDSILAINNLDTSAMTLSEAVGHIRGPEGTQVVLTIVRAEKPLTEFEEISVTRSVIHIESVIYEIRKDGIAYVTISNFNEDTRALFADAVSTILATPTIKGIVLDLRNNPGGFLDTAVKVSGYWAGDQVVVREKFSTGAENEYQAGLDPVLATYPTVVLINEGSASASEIVAGALRDYGLATLIGETTFGKGTVQTLEALPDGSSIKYTIAEWLTPLGHSIDSVGIAPDIEIEQTIEDFENDIDPQLDRAFSELLGS